MRMEGAIARCLQLFFLCLTCASEAFIDSPAEAKPDGELFFQAAYAGDLVTMKNLLASGADPNISEEHGLTPLLGACISHSPDRLEAVKVLAKAGANINAADATGETALHYAVRQGNAELAEVLLENGADATAANKKGYTPGFLAVVLADDPKVYLVLDLIVQSRSDYWLTLPDLSYRTIWQRASKEDLRHLPPEPSFWQMQYMTFTEDRRIWAPIGAACLASLPLTALIVFLESSVDQTRVERNRGDPSRGAQQLASKVTAGSLSGAVAFRMLEVVTATVLPAWTFGYYLMPRLSVTILTMVYIVPVPLLVGLMPTLRYPALLLASAPKSIVRDPTRTLRLGLPTILLRCAVLLAFPWVIINLPYSWMAASLRFNSQMELPSRNEWSIVHPGKQYPEDGTFDTAGFDCLLAPAELMEMEDSNFREQSSASTCLSEWMPWAHLYLPTMLLGAAITTWLGLKSCVAESDLQASAALECRIRELARSFDRIAREAEPDDPHVWRKISEILEIERKGSESWVEPLNLWNFWKTPYFDLGLLTIDFVSDVLTMANVFSHRHFHLGSILLASLLSSTASELWIGNTPVVVFREARESARIGFRTERFQNIQLHEVGFEALPSLAVSVFTFWFNVSSRFQLVILAMSLSTSILSLAKFLHRKLDLELPHCWEEDEDDALLPTFTTSARDQELVEHESGRSAKVPLKAKP